MVLANEPDHISECPVCRYASKGYLNIYGRVCTKCGEFIEPDVEPKFVTINNQQKQKNQETVRYHLRKKMRRTDNVN